MTTSSSAITHSDFAVAVFAKAPVAGEVKTRLIPLLGPEGAARIHREMIVHALAIAQQAAPGRVALWIAGQSDHPFFIDCANRFDIPQHVQASGDLGLRMHDCLTQSLQRDAAVLLIGTDCPVMTASDLQRAAQALHARPERRMVFTPADDGGYVLVGARRVDAVPADTLSAAFDDIAWSIGSVMAQTRERLQASGWHAGRQWCETAPLWDVDMPDDFLRAVALGLLDRNVI